MSQTPSNACRVMTATAGKPIADKQNSLTAGPRGPILLQDWQLIEKLAHQNRERIPERTVHAKGWGAFGTFTVTKDITKYTRAEIFGAVGKKTGMLRPILDRRRRAGRGRRRARCARRRAALLHRTGQLGPGGQQHAGVLHPRPAEVPRLHPHPEAPPGDEPAQQHRSLGLMEPEPREPASGDDPDERPRHPGEPALHERPWLAHLQLLERGRRALLGQVPLQDAAGPQDADECRGRGRHRQEPRELRRRPARRHRARRIPKVDRVRAGHARARRRRRRRTTPST